MPDRESVINGLECCWDVQSGWKDARYVCPICPYTDNGIPCETLAPLMEDALALLKAQEARVMTWEEAQVNVNDGPFIIMEVRDSTGTEIDYGVLVGDSYEMSEGSLLDVCDFDMLKNDYGKRFRVWTSCPTKAEREATPWNAQEQRDYEAAVEMAEYCERYEPTYNSDDGSI